MSTDQETIRTMAQSLLDNDIDLLSQVTVITFLVASGWSTKQIEKYYASATTMALMRKENKRRNQ